MTKLYKFAFVPELSKIMVMELEAVKRTYSYWIPPITDVYESELDNVMSDGVMYSLKNDMDAYIYALIEWKKREIVRTIAESEKLIAESKALIKKLEKIDKEEDVRFFDVKGSLV